jgi:hypothetical protein
MTRSERFTSSVSVNIMSYEFFGPGKAVDVSFRPGPGGSPLGLAMSNRKENKGGAQH